uniref:Uncharacterized protein n=1 Tax=Ditylenchus dipsaci TaxID=166011 RepID=A0A915DEX3_9BILA
MIITPTVAYASHFDKYKLFVHNYEPDKILSQEEYDEMTDIVFEKIKIKINLCSSLMSTRRKHSTRWRKF